MALLRHTDHVTLLPGRGQEPWSAVPARGWWSV